MAPIQITCCHIEVRPTCTKHCSKVADWAFWTEGTDVYSTSYACATHLGDMLPSNADMPEAICLVETRVWGLVDGYDPSTTSHEDLVLVGAANEGAV